MKSKITRKRLKEVLHYNPYTGDWLWLKKINNNASDIGSTAGYINTHGYRYIGIDNKVYNSNRLAFLYMEGYFPENIVDHENRIRHDDRWCNLRHISRQCNSRNCKLSNKNKSGITGVSFYKRDKKWKASITILYKNFNLGVFKTKLEAANARWQSEKENSFPNCNTTSTAYQYILKHG